MKNTKTAFSTSSKNRAKKTTERRRLAAARPWKLFLCDLGNVLINFDHRIAVRRIREFTDRSFDEVYQFFFDSPLTKDFEEGRLSPEEFFRRVKTKLGIRGLAFRDFVPIWNEIFFDNKGMMELLRKLKKSYRLHLVSNINELHYGYIVSRFPEHIAIFDDVCLSCRLGRRKPDRAIYRRAIEAAGVEAGEAFYADDREDLVDVARRLGIRSFLFKSVAGFRAELKKSHILS